MAKGGYIYILSNYNRTVLYTGVTSNLFHRIYQHKHGQGSTFTQKYNCFYLLYYEFFPDIESAIRREKRIKKYKREWKWNLIREQNPKLDDLFEQVRDMQ